MTVLRCPRRVMHEHVPDRHVYYHVALRLSMSEYMYILWVNGRRLASTCPDMSEYMLLIYASDLWVNERSRVVDGAAHDQSCSRVADTHHILDVVQRMSSQAASRILGVASCVISHACDVVVAPVTF